MTGGPIGQASSLSLDGKPIPNAKVAAVARVVSHPSGMIAQLPVAAF